jgi:hypothetical protein
MKRINNITDLQQERNRLRMQVKRLEQEIIDDVSLIREDLKPVNLVGKFVNNLFHREDNGITSAGLNVGIDVLLREILLRRAGWVYRLLVPFFVKNVANNYVASGKIDFVEMAKNLYHKWRGNNQTSMYDKGTADIDY